MDCLFVYGTLRKEFGHPLGLLLASRAEFIGIGYVFGHLYDLGEYPGIQLDPSTERRVVGDVYQLHYPVQMLSDLDDYEGVSDTYSSEFPYRRVVDTVYVAEEPFPQVWIYEYTGKIEGFQRILCGDYLDYLKAREPN